MRLLQRELVKEIVTEMEFTIKVAVLSAAGFTRPQIVKNLDTMDVEVRCALARLKRVAERT